MASSQVRVGEIAFLADRERESVRYRVGWESGGGGVEIASPGCGRGPVAFYPRGRRCTVDVAHAQAEVERARDGDWLLRAVEERISVQQHVLDTRKREGVGCV